MDSLILMWKHPETKKNYVIGLLSKLSKRYRFTYLKNEVNTALEFLQEAESYFKILLKNTN